MTEDPETEAMRRLSKKIADADRYLKRQLLTGADTGLARSAIGDLNEQFGIKREEIAAGVESRQQARATARSKFVERLAFDVKNQIDRRMADLEPPTTPRTTP